MPRGVWREKSPKVLQQVEDTFNIHKFQHLNMVGVKYCCVTDTSGTNPGAGQFPHGGISHNNVSEYLTAIFLSFPQEHCHRLSIIHGH